MPQWTWLRRRSVLEWQRSPDTPTWTEANRDAMTVRTALALINQVLDEVLVEQESEFDAATRFAIKWFEQ